MSVNSYTSACMWWGRGWRGVLPCPLHLGSAQRDLAVPSDRLGERESVLGCKAFILHDYRSITPPLV